MVGRRIRRGLKRIWVGSYSGHAKVPCVLPSGWDIFLHYLYPILGPPSQLKYGEKLVIRDLNALQKCGTYFGPNYFFYFKFLCSKKKGEKNNPPLLVGCVRISLLAPHRRYKTQRRHVAIEYHKKETKVLIRFAACCRNHDGFLQWGCDGRSDQLKGDEHDRELKRQKEEMVIELTASEAVSMCECEGECECECM